MSDGMNDNVWSDEDDSPYRDRNVYAKEDPERCKELLSEILEKLEEKYNSENDPEIFDIIIRIKGRNVL